jgi:alpha-amylase/alpha-mannosidase (GH57 family)
MGESVRRSNELVPQLMAKECEFTYQERRQLFDLIGELIKDVIPRYRKLQDRGQVEISTTPYYHPILPLLLDFDCAREAMPQAELPKTPRYPGGRERASKQVEEALENYREHFGSEPHGMWPGEGGISLPASGVLAEHGCEWTASGETVLFNSLRRLHGDGMPERMEYLYRPHRCLTEKGDIFCFFRDDRLSDKIGFEYTKWHGRDAVNDFISTLEGIRNHSKLEEEPVVSVILDGENAWEYYPYNGYYFLAELYEALQDHPFIQTTTFGECVNRLGASAPKSKRIPLEPGSLPAMVSGSWVYGTFSTWIGMADKNHAWDLLCAAKTSYDRVINSGRLNDEDQHLAEQQLGICEGSDWFWWFGDYNPGLSVQSFDRLYRLNLTNLYQLLKLPAPVELQHPISAGQGGDVAMGGTMRRGSE